MPIHTRPMPCWTFVFELPHGDLTERRIVVADGTTYFCAEHRAREAHFGHNRQIDGTLHPFEHPRLTLSIDGAPARGTQHDDYINAREREFAADVLLPTRWRALSRPELIELEPYHWAVRIRDHVRYELLYTPEDPQFWAYDGGHLGEPQRCIGHVPTAELARLMMLRHGEYISEESAAHLKNAMTRMEEAEANESAEDQRIAKLWDRMSDQPSL